MAVLDVSPYMRCTYNVTKNRRQEDRGHCNRHIIDSALVILVPALAVLEPAALLRLILCINTPLLLRPSTVVRAKLAALWKRITLAV